MPDLGKKHECSSCGARFYDLGKAETVCPKCGTHPTEPEAEPEPAPAPKPKGTARSRSPKEPPDEGSDDSDDDDELEDEDDLDDEELEEDLIGADLEDDDDDDDDGGNDRVSAVLLDLCQHQIEQATAEYRFVGVNPSTIAAAAVLNGLDAFAWEGVCAPSSAGFELRRLVSLPGSIQRTARIELASPQVRACRKVLGGRVVQLCAGRDMRRRLEEAVGTAAVGRGEEGVALLRPRRESLGRSGSPVSVVP